MKNSLEENLPTWYKLDNSAKIYPATRSKTRSNVFRVSVVLKEEVEPELLARALEAVLVRVPYFSVRMHRGLFWYYLEPSTGAPEVQPDTLYPCSQMHWKGRGGFLFKVLYYSRTISLEFFHSLTDGSGGMEFLKVLCAQYLSLKGYEIEKSDSILDINKPPFMEELEDSFLKYAGKGRLNLSREGQAYRIIGTFETPGKHHITTGLLRVDEVLAVSRAMKVTITEYLAAILIHVLYRHQQKHHPIRVRPVKVSIPVNLRQRFESQTLRNFTLSINTGIDPRLGEYSFEEILSQVHHFMRYSMSEKFLKARMSTYVSAERNPFLRAAPLFVKNKCLAVVLNMLHDSTISSTLSNIGKIVVPDSISEYVERFEAMSNPSRMKPVSCVVVSHRNTLVINFTRAIKESDIEREFFRFLVRQGLHVKIESSDSQ